MTSRFKIALQLFAVLFLFVMISPAQAEYPDRAVNYIVPFGPGGESDISARLQQPYFKKKFDQDLIIQYKPGAGGAVGWASLNGYKGDGYTIMGTNLPHIVLKPMQKGSSFTLKDITNVYFFHYTPNAIVVPADSPFKTVEDLIKAAKAAPGAVTFAGTGTFSTNHLAKAQFDNLVGITTTYIPFKTTADAAMAMLGKQVSAHWGYTTVGIAQGEKVRLLAIAAESRHPLFPNVPTFKELGYDFVGGAYRGLAVPSTTPEAQRVKISDMLGQINKDPKFIKQMVEAGFTLCDIPYAEIPAFLEKQRVEYLRLAESLGLKVK